MGKAPRRFGLVLCVLVVAACTFAAAAYAVNVTYAPYTWWFVGNSASGNYDSSGHRWYSNQMMEKSCGGESDCWGRVALILTDGTWAYSWTDETSDTEILLSSGDPYWSSTKKPYCKDNANFSDYYVECIAAHE